MNLTEQKMQANSDMNEHTGEHEMDPKEEARILADEFCHLWALWNDVPAEHTGQDKSDNGSL
jgi:hypothetical protein